MAQNAFIVRDELVSRVENLIEDGKIGVKKVRLNAYGVYDRPKEQPTFIIDLIEPRLVGNVSAYAEETYSFDCAIVMNINDFEDDDEYDKKKQEMYADAEMIINALIGDWGEVTAGLIFEVGVDSQDMSIALAFRIEK